MKVLMEEGYNTTPVLKFLYGKHDEWSFRIPPAKAKIILKYLKLIQEYSKTADASYKATKHEGKIDFTLLREFQEEKFKSLVVECEGDKDEEEVEVEMKDEKLIAKPEPKEEKAIETIIPDASGTITFK